jgi:hypothetical protein
MRSPEAIESTRKLSGCCVVGSGMVSFFGNYIFFYHFAKINVGTKYFKIIP